jgi:TPR repeat protein
MYCKMAAEMGNAYAQSTLANAYTIGRDVEQSDELAFFWYTKAAEQGYPYAQYELGKRLRDEEGGLLWIHLSAKQGFTIAMKELSDRLLFSDPKASRKWLKRYYRNKDKRDAWRWHGKKYMREFKRERQPEVIDGEVVIWI